VRDTNRSNQGGRIANPPNPVTVTSASSAPPPASGSDDTTTTSAPTGSGTAATAPAPVADPTATSSIAAPAGSTATTAAGSGAAAYGQSGIIAALQALVKDLSNSQVLSNTDSSSGLSSNVLSNLNSAFGKLSEHLGFRGQHHRLAPRGSATQ
jgi:hypothetical protein